MQQFSTTSSLTTQGSNTAETSQAAQQDGSNLSATTESQGLISPTEQLAAGNGDTVDLAPGPTQLQEGRGSVRRRQGQGRKTNSANGQPTVLLTAGGGRSSNLPSYSTSNENRSKLNKILGVSQGWSVWDRESTLDLIHYNSETGMLAQVGHLRGVVVDTAVGLIVASSYGYTPVATVDKITPLDDGSVSIDDQLGFNHRFKSFQMKIGLEGVVIRVFKHGGKVYRATHRTLNPIHSHWGRSTYFLDMYWQLGGPKDEDLFDASVDYSPWCYVFLVVHPDLLVGTRQKVSKGYIALLTINKMWDPVKLNENYPTTVNWKNVDQGPHKQINFNPEMPAIITEPFIYGPQALTLEQANNHLRNGYYAEFPVKDERARSGEFLVLYNFNEQGQVISLLKVQSDSYTWRLEMRDDNPNIPHRFSLLWNYVLMPILDRRRDTGFAELKRRFISFPLYNKEAIKQHLEREGPFITLQEAQLDPKDLETQQGRLHLIWINFIFSLPPNQQIKAINLLDDFNTGREELIRWAVELNDNSNVTEDEEISRRVRDIITSARRGKGQRGLTREQVRQNIRNLILKEPGQSLYKMVREMKQDKEPKPVDSASVATPLISSTTAPISAFPIPSSNFTTTTSSPIFLPTSSATATTSSPVQILPTGFIPIAGFIPTSVQSTSFQPSALSGGA
jgi:hypothetical protein